MNLNTSFPSDVAFSPSVKAMQARLGSRHAYERMERERGWDTTITPDLQALIEAQESVFLATASSDGQPYIQHRGGPPGFLHVPDERTIAWAEFAGNRQYITGGNLAENDRAQLFLIDYATRTRVKIWGRARLVEDDPALVARLMPPGYEARGERALVFDVTAWDTNCRKHIPQRFEAADVAAALAQRDARIEALEQELRALRAR
jgi:predicted pyridoxine 5'-phosphate oxidase superfamily flavin-nucleotide-binding protein